jgi:hypothetical protein
MKSGIHCPHCDKLCELQAEHLDLGENYVRCSECFSEFILIIEVEK